MPADIVDLDRTLVIPIEATEMGQATAILLLPRSAYINSHLGDSRSAGSTEARSLLCSDINLYRAVVFANTIETMQTVFSYLNVDIHRAVAARYIYHNIDDIDGFMTSPFYRRINNSASGGRFTDVHVGLRNTIQDVADMRRVLYRTPQPPSLRF